MLKRLLAVSLLLSLAACVSLAGSPSPDPLAAPGRKADQAEKRDQQLRDLNSQLIDQFKKSDYTQCRKLLDRIISLKPDDATAWYNMACVESRTGQSDKAMANLTKAVDLGYTDFAGMQKDEDLAALRELADFKTLIGKQEQAQLAQAKKIRDELAKQYGSQCVYEVDTANKLIFATNIDKQTLDDLKTSLLAHAQGLWNDMFDHRPTQFVTIVVPAPDPADKNDPILGGGFYEHGKRTLIAHQIGMVLFHEFTHAMHAADQDALGQHHPIWILEGYSTFYETSKLVDGHLVPVPNNRLAVLQAYAARNQTIPWRKFVKYEQPQYMKECNICYPQSRYMLVYLYDKGLFKKWYDTYTSTYDQDPTGVKAWETVFGKKFEDIEQDWLKWVAQQPTPPLRLVANQPYLGVKTGPAVDGMAITSVVPGSGADQCGIKAGDTLCAIDGERTVDSCELVRMISNCNVGQELSVKIRRNGEYQTLKLTLSAMPQSVAGNTPPAKPAPRQATSAPAVRKAA